MRRFLTVTRGADGRPVLSRPLRAEQVRRVVGALPGAAVGDTDRAAGFCQSARVGALLEVGAGPRWCLVFCVES